MADPTRKKNKGKDSQPSARMIRIDSGDPLHIITDHEEPSLIELHQFRDGKDRSLTKQNFIPFTGRPQLIAELAPAIERHYRSAAPNTCRTLEGSLVWWWRFFDQIADSFPVTSVADLDDMHYALYANLGSEMPSANIASNFFRLVNTARSILSQSLPQQEKLLPLLWTAKEKPTPERALVSMTDVRHLYHHVKHLCFAAVQRYKNDPCAEPTSAEINALFIMFVMVSGWNAAVVANIDIDGEYVTPHPTNPQFSYVASQKRRAKDNVQFALSRNKSDISPANILTAIIAATKEMRKCLEQYLEELIKKVRAMEKAGAKIKELNSLKVKIGEVRQGVNSPWLHRQDANSPTYLGTVAEGIAWKSGSADLRHKSRSVLRHYSEQINSTLPASIPRVNTGITLRDLRDAYISWRWMTSASWLDAMLAAGHTSRHSLVRYLKRKQIKERSRREFIKMGDAMWTSIQEDRAHGRPITLTLSIMAKLEKVSDEQIRRWSEGKDKTYVGMGCLDFNNPPKDIAPHHRAGDGCRIQRCTLCSHAILLPDSDDHLARRLAELRFQRANIPEQAWQESTYPAEIENTEAALERFDLVTVAELIAKWEDAIRNGSHVPVTTEGAYA